MVYETYAKDQDWTVYYLDAEGYTVDQFREFKEALGDWARRDHVMYESCLDFACGYGRFGKHMCQYAKKITFADIRKDAVDMCRLRFNMYKNSNVQTNDLANCDYDYVQNTESHIPLPDGSISFFYSWDAMVHFEVKELRATFNEVARVLRSGGRGAFQHSNLKNTGEPQGFWHANHGSRSWVSMEEVGQMLADVGLKVVRQTTIDRGLPKLDAVTLFEKI